MADDETEQVEEVLRQMAAPRIEHGTLGWVMYECEADPTEPRHIVPTRDIRGHVLKASCACQPDPDPDGDNILRHNSFDGRERYEYEGARRH